MTNTYLLSIDPGMSTGIALGLVSDDEPYALVDTWQPKDGVVGFLRWWNSSILYDTMGGWTERDLIVAELFTLRNNQFVANIEPVRIEGALYALGIQPIYQQPAMKSLVGDRVLKRSGLWIDNPTARQKFDHGDGRDANDAIIHALAFLKRTLHRPTLLAYWPEAIDD